MIHELNPVQFCRTVEQYSLTCRMQYFSLNMALNLQVVLSTDVSYSKGSNNENEVDIRTMFNKLPFPQK